MYQFDVAYHPGVPQSLSDWQAETGALLVVNGGFFTPEFHATGLIIAAGVAEGSSYDGFGGMVAITEAGIEVRSLAERPYTADEPLTAAVQSFPLLVQPGGTNGYADEDGQPARRTVIAQDRNGRLLLIIAPLGSFTLHQLSQYLLASDLDLDIALNLDGGSSTGMLLTDLPLHIPAFTMLPAVITVSATPLTPSGNLPQICTGVFDLCNHLRIT
ncbi:MAG: phosphodiester glycosidase family protein [Chloroflexota bacterium]